MAAAHSRRQPWRVNGVDHAFSLVAFKCGAVVRLERTRDRGARRAGMVGARLHCGLVPARLARLQFQDNLAAA